LGRHGTTQGFLTLVWRFYLCG